ncbi:ADP-ribosylation factor-like protein 6-interacting protein 1 [Vulpes vulpes]
MRRAAVGRAAPELEFNPPNEERASRGLSGKLAGLYKRPAGRPLALGSPCGSRRGARCVREGPACARSGGTSGTMAEGDNRSTNLLAAETASLEEQLQGWGEVMLMADKVLRWERAWFPPAIMGVVSLLFLTIYYLDPSVLSGVSCFVMFLCLADYLVPILAPRIFGSNKWTTEQQQRFHEICSNLVKTRRRAVGWWKRLFTLKEEKPKMYFMTMIVSLAAVAWVGQQVHNLLLTYLIVTFLLLLPGLNQHGIILKYIGMAKREINKLLKQKEKKNE